MSCYYVIVFIIVGTNENVDETDGNGYYDDIKTQVQNGKLEEIQNDYLYINSASASPEENESSTDGIYEIVPARSNDGVNTERIILQEIYENVAFDNEAVYDNVVPIEEHSLSDTIPIQDDQDGAISIQDDLEGTISIQDDLEGSISTQDDLTGSISEQDLAASISTQHDCAGTVPMQDDLASTIRDDLAGIISVQDDLGGIPVQEIEIEIQ